MKNSNVRRMSKGIALMLAMVLVLSTAVMASAATGNISWTKAKSIALEKAPKATVKYLVSSVDDGKDVYVGKLVKGKYLYDIEIDAVNGRVLEYERDYIGSKTTSANINSY